MVSLLLDNTMGIVKGDQSARLRSGKIKKNKHVKSEVDTIRERHRTSVVKHQYESRSFSFWREDAKLSPKQTLGVILLFGATVGVFVYYVYRSILQPFLT